MRSIAATALKPRMVLALPMGRTAVVTEVTIGRQYVNFSTKEYGKSRASRYDHFLIDDAGENNPMPGDVALIRGEKFMVREIRGERARVAAGRTDPGYWIDVDDIKVIYRRKEA